MSNERKDQQKSRFSKIGKPPGTAVYVGKQKVEKTMIEFTEYDSANYTTTYFDTFNELKAHIESLKSKSVKWVNINGLHDVELLENIGAYFGLHPLVIEDILDSTQRPKTEYYDDYLFTVVKRISLNEKNEVQFDQISLIFGKGFVFSFQDSEYDFYDTLQERIEGCKGIIRKSGADYLLYVLIDVVVDNYFLVIEEFNDRIEPLQEEILARAEQKHIVQIQALKREVNDIRQLIWPFREVLSGIQRGETDLIYESHLIYFRDTYDHLIRIVDSLDSFRESIVTLSDIYLSSMSNRMNQTMKILTTIATIFIPLTFIAGIYGMNFEFMPELKWKYGYFVVWGLMLAVGIFLGLYFKKKQWL